jgi:hypothetical protein
MMYAWTRTMAAVILVAVIVSSLALVGSPVVSNAQEGIDLDQITEGVGRYHELTPNAASPRVFLLQESHNQVSGLLEGAVMIDRLVHHYGLKRIAVEGAFPITSFDTSWLSDRLPAGAVRAVAVTMLAEGEINQAELAAVVYPRYVTYEVQHGFTVFGIDDEHYYAQPEPPEEAYGEFEIAMIYTALARLGDAEFEQAATMLGNVPGDGASDEEFEAWREGFYDLIFASSPDAGIRAWYEMSDPTLDECMSMGVDQTIAEFDAGLAIIRQHQAATEDRLGESLDPMIAHAEAERSFHVDAHEREITMIYEIEGWLEAEPGSMIAALIGAAHTDWMEQQLEADGYSTVVLSPESLCDESTAVSLSPDAFAGKYDAGSVGGAGTLGVILEDMVRTPKKPKIVLEQPWAKLETTIRVWITILTQELRKGDAADLSNLFDDMEFPGISFDLADLERIGDDAPPRYVVPVQVHVEGVPEGTIFVGIIADQADPQNQDLDELDLETLLLNARDDIRADQQPKNADASENAQPGAAPVVEIGPSVRAAVSTDKTAVMNAMRGTR